MLDFENLQNVKTVGAFIVNDSKFAFMIGPNASKDKLGIVRFGGHVEKNEHIYECLLREINEETSSTATIVSSPITYYKGKWEEDDYIELEKDLPLDIKPIIIVGDSNYLTMLFLAYVNEELKPSNETHGIIYLSISDIQNICNNRLTLNRFIKKGGKIVQQKKIDYEMELYPGPHLKFLNYLLKNNYNVVDSYLNMILL